MLSVNKHEVSYRGNCMYAGHYAAIVNSVNVTTLKSSGDTIRRAKSPVGISVVKFDLPRDSVQSR